MSTNKPSYAEEEFFAREEAEKKRKLSLVQIEALAAAEKERLAALHHMHCPRCGMQLQDIALSGVMVSRCFGCHGIFMDAGNVEKLLGQKGYWSRLISFFAGDHFTEALAETLPESLPKPLSEPTVELLQNPKEER